MNAAALRLCLVVAFLLSGCAKSSDVEKPILKVGNSLLLPSELARAVQEGPPGDSATKAALFIEDWRRAASLYEQALDEGEPARPETATLLEKSRRKIIAERFVERKLQEAWSKGLFRVDSMAVKSYFDAQSSSFKFAAPMFKLTRFYATKADSALRFRQVMSAPLSLDSLFELAMQSAPEAAELNQLAFESGLRLQTFSQLHLESENLRALLERMKPKDISPVMKLSDSLFVVMRLEERVSQGEPKTFSQAYPDIVERLALINQKRFIDSLAKLKN
jgi:hypothetical protein